VARGPSLLHARGDAGPDRRLERWTTVDARPPEDDTPTGGADRDPDAGARRGSWLRRLLAVTSVIVVALALVVGVSVWSFDRSIQRVDVEGLGADRDDDRDDGAEAAELEDEADARPLTVLVLGSDSREDLTPEEQRELGTGDAPGTRTEVISLVRLAPDDDELRLLNVPRDSRVERCDGTVGRINAAYSIGEEDGRGGATCVVQTLHGLLGVPIDHVVTVDFRGFVQAIDQLGGVTMALDEPLQDPGSHLDLPAGCVTLDGRDALAFVRARQIDDDYGRIARQHRLVEEVRQELAEVGVLGDLPRSLRLAETLAGAVELDSSLTLNRLQQLVRQHRSTVQGELTGRAVPGEVAVIGEASMLELDEERALELASWLLDGQDPAEAAVPRGTGSAVESGAAEAPADDGAEGSSEASTDSDGPRTLSGQAPAGLSGTAPPGGC
jgi:LCP family protein required for cell wall assembly